MSNWFSFLVGAVLNIVLILFLYPLVLHGAALWTNVGMLQHAAAIGVSVISFCYFGLLGIDENKVEKDLVENAVLLVLGRRVRLIVGEGYFWRLPNPLMGKVAFNTQAQPINLKHTDVLSKDNYEITFVVQIIIQIVDGFSYTGASDATSQLGAAGESAIREFGKEMDGIELNTVDSKKKLKKILEEDNGVVHSAARDLGMKISRIQVQDIDLPDKIVEANIAKVTEEAQRVSETTETDTVLGLMERYKKKFPSLSDEAIANLVQAERGKATRIIVEGGAGDFTKGAALTGVMGSKRSS